MYLISGKITSQIKLNLCSFIIINTGWLNKMKKHEYEWQQQIQVFIEEIDKGIKDYKDEDLTLQVLSKKFGYSEFYITKRFKEISGVLFRDYVRRRKLAFALKEIRDSKKDILEIAFDYGFSSHEAFTRSFKKLYSITPSEYRKKPVPVVLRTKIKPFDRYFLGIGEIGMMKSTEDIKVYFITVPAHKFLYIKNYDSDGYWDFWKKQSQIPGQDCETICGLLDSIKGKLDDRGGSEPNSGAGQIMAYINDPKGKAECYGVRLPADYKGEVPSQMILQDVPEGEYIVFEHGKFNYEQENCSVEEKVKEAIDSYDFASTGYSLDDVQGRVEYFYHDPAQFFKVVKPVRKCK